MIVLIDGSFGVGKTSVVTALCALSLESVLFDPESIGSYARLATAGIRAGAENTDDFQDIVLWRTFTIATG